MDVDDVQDVLKTMYEEGMVFFTVSEIKNRMEDGDNSKNSSQISSRLKNYERSEKYTEPPVEEYTKAGNSRIYAFSDRVRLNFPYFNEELDISKVQDVIDFFREDIEKIIQRELRKQNIDSNMEFGLNVRNGKVEVKLLTRKVLE